MMSKYTFALVPELLYGYAKQENPYRCKTFKKITQRNKSSTYRLFGFKLNLIYNECGEPMTFIIA